MDKPTDLQNATFTGSHKYGTCTKAENTPYAGPHTGYNGQCPAVVLPNHSEPQRISFPVNSDNTDSH